MSLNFLKLFNDKFMDMVKDLAAVFPQDKDLKAGAPALRLFLLTDDRAIQKIFHQTVIDLYRDKIVSRDETFFLSQTYDHLAEPSAAEATADIVSKLKGCWANLTAENRESIWKYLNLLIVLDDKITGA